MLQWLASFLTAPIINGFLDAYKAKLDAKNNAGAQAVEVTRAALIAEIEARKSANAMLVAEQGRWYTAIIRPLLALPVIIYLWKVIVWDIVLGLGSTAPSPAMSVYGPAISSRPMSAAARSRRSPGRYGAGHDRRPLRTSALPSSRESLPHGGRARQDVGQGRRDARDPAAGERCALGDHRGVGAGRLHHRRLPLADLARVSALWPLAGAHL